MKGWIDNIEKAQNGYNIGDKVRYGTPEYKEAYDKGEVVTKKGVHSPILLPEVVIKRKKQDKNWLEQYKDKIVEENKDAGILGAIVGTPISAITSLPQLFGMKALTGEMQRPSEALDIQNSYGALALDTISDPTNLLGVGLLTKEKLLNNINKVNPSNILSKVNKKSTFSKNLSPDNFNHNLIDFEDLESLMEKYKDETFKKFGRELTNKELGLYSKLQEIKQDRLKSLYPDEHVFVNSLKNKLVVNDTYKSTKEILDPFIQTHEISNNYTPREIVLADSYQWGYDNYFNKRPEVTVDDNLFNPLIDEFEELVKKNKTKRPEKFFRNQDDFYVQKAWNKNGEPLINKKYKDLVPGDEYEPGSFVSTTLSPTNYSSGTFLTEIIVPENQSFLNMASTGNRKFYSEAENILPRNLRFRIEDIQDYKSDDVYSLNSTNKKIKESIVNPYKNGGIIKDDKGYWNPDNWGKNVEIGSGDITMEGVYEPLIGISKETGEKKIMIPGKNYKFANTKSVIEKPIHNNWLDKYN